MIENNGQKIKILVNQGKSVLEIAAIVGIGYSSVMYWIKKEKIKPIKKSRQKLSKIYTISKEELQIILNQSYTNKDLFQKLSNGIQGSNLWSSTYSRALKQRIEKDGLDDTKFRQNNKQYLKKINKKTTDNLKSKYENVFCQNSSAQRYNVKKRIIKENLIKYQCKQCKNSGIHNGKQLILQLQHINGVSNDNRLQNLCFLCPNCHSQTDTFSGRKNKKLEQNYCQCGNEMCQTSIKCIKCNSSGSQIYRRKFNPTKEQLENKLQEFNGNKSKTGMFYGVSDNSIKRRMKLLNII